MLPPFSLSLPQAEEIVLLKRLGSGLPAWWGRSPLGVPFCCQKGTKDHQRRGLPPPCGIHPAGTGWSVRPPLFGPGLVHVT